MSSLKAIEQFLHLPEVKLKKPADAHWLSHDTACHTLVKVSSSEIRDYWNNVLNSTMPLVVHYLCDHS